MCMLLIILFSVTFNSFQWLEKDFLSYLDKWEESVSELPGLSRAQRNNMLLSPETRLGLRTTGNCIHVGRMSH